MTGTNERLTAALRDRYAIERELGQGGMATVYLARDLRHERPMALVTPDGSRFLVVKPIEQPGKLPVVVALNRFQELRDTVRP